MSRPRLETARLVLRPFAEADAADVERHVSDRRVADTTLNIPHPYPPGSAAEWIATHDGAWEAGTRAAFAITLRDTGRLIGAIGVTITPRHRRGEIGYWIGYEHWHHGYATEAAAEILRFAFEDLDLERVIASHFPRNPVSGRVLAKIGMRWEGRSVAHVIRDGRREDLERYAILRDEWRARHRDPPPDETTVRPARPGDRDEWRRMRGGIYDSLSPAEHDADIDAIMADPGQQAAFVAPRPEGGLCAFIEMRLRSVADDCVTSPVAYVETWYVDPDRRRAGLGRALMRAAARWGRERGCAEMASDALAANSAAIEAHRAVGFTAGDRVQCFHMNLRALPPREA